eukprot:tig00000248_g21814.t1
MGKKEEKDLARLRAVQRALHEHFPSLRPKICVKGRDDKQLYAIFNGKARKKLASAIAAAAATAGGCSACKAPGTYVDVEGARPSELPDEPENALFFATEYELEIPESEDGDYFYKLSSAQFLCRRCYSMQDAEQWVPFAANPENKEEAAEDAAHFARVNGRPESEGVDACREAYGIAFTLRMWAGSLGERLRPAGPDGAAPGDAAPEALVAELVRRGGGEAAAAPTPKKKKTKAGDVTPGKERAGAKAGGEAPAPRKAAATPGRQAATPGKAAAATPGKVVPGKTPGKAKKPAPPPEGAPSAKKRRGTGS